MGVKLTRRGLWKVLLAITNRREGNIGNEVGTPRERRQLAQTKPDQNPWASTNAEPHLIILLSLSLPQQHCTIKRKRFQKCVKQRGKCAQRVCCWERTGLNQGKRWMRRLLEGQQWPRTPIVTSVSEPKRFSPLETNERQRLTAMVSVRFERVDSFRRSAGWTSDRWSSGDAEMTRGHGLASPSCCFFDSVLGRITESRHPAATWSS